MWTSRGLLKWGRQVIPVWPADKACLKGDAVCGLSSGGLSGGTYS